MQIRAIRAFHHSSLTQSNALVTNDKLNPRMDTRLRQGYGGQADKHGFFNAIDRNTGWHSNEGMAPVAALVDSKFNAFL